VAAAPAAAPAAPESSSAGAGAASSEAEESESLDRLLESKSLLSSRATGATQASS